MSETRDAAPLVATDRPLVVETALVLGIGLALLLLGTLAYLLLLGEPIPPASIPLYVGAILGWRSVIWVLATIGIAAVLRNGTRRRRMHLSLVAAVAAVTVATLIRYGPSIAFMGQGIAFAAVPWLLELAAFFVCALLGWLLAIRLLDAAPGTRAAQITPVATALLLVIGGAGILGLVGQWFGLYFRIWATSSPTYDDFGPEGVRYLVTAGLSIAALIAALVLALVRRARGLATLSGVLLGVCLLFAFVFQVPQGRFIPEPETYELPSDYTPCFGGLDDPGCEGG